MNPLGILIGASTKNGAFGLMEDDKPSRMPEIVDPLAMSLLVAEAYENRSIAAVNDHEIRMSVMTSGFPWHRHPDSDETFAVLEGELVIEFETGEVILKPGQFLTVSRGVLHRTRPKGDRSVNLTFECVGAVTEFLS